VAENVGHWLTETQQRFDLALAAISALLVGGVIFNSFGLASWVFASSATTAWTLWFIGFGLWMFALAVFFTFMNHPAPRHGIRR
jgi:Zn-dependent membrane protease YugP